MYKHYLKQYIISNAYLKIEHDNIYLQLRLLLESNLPTNIFLDVEELLHEEIIFKLTEGFKYGFSYGVNYKNQAEWKSLLDFIKTLYVIIFLKNDPYYLQQDPQKHQVF